MLTRQFPQPLLNLVIISPLRYRSLDLAIAISSQTWRSLARNSSSKRVTSALHAMSSGSFSDHRLQHVLVQIQIGNQLLQPPFSSRRCLTSSASLTSMPPYFAFQA